ncbi:hypothetical protein A9Q99_23870 [Gammaproteobacteria bacterium 45_16_T64]|nr:hypothetical protein A9Q99_23870 [Gammaproteobacteria bacterium 45_16_T64]
MSEQQDRNYFRGILGVIFANFPFISRLFMICIAISILVPFFVVTKYTLTGEIVVLSKKIQQGIRGDITGGTSARYIPVSLTDMETENNIIRSVPLIRKTAADLYDEGKLKIEYGVLDTWIKNPLRNNIVKPIKSWFTEVVEDERLAAIEELTKIALDSLEVSTIPGSNVIVVNYESENKETALLFVNKLMSNFLEKRNELLLNEAPEDFFLRKKNSYKDRLVSLELKKVELFGRYAVTNTKDELALILESINHESNELNNVLDNRLEANAWLSYLKEQLENLKVSDVSKISFPYSFGGSSTGSNEFFVDTEMKDQILKISSLQSEHANAKLAFRKGSAKVTRPYNQLKQQKIRLITLVENRILERYEGIKVLDTIIESKKSRIQLFKDRAEVLKAVQAQEAGIITELNAVNDAYFKYSQQYEERRSEKIANLEDLSNVRILSLAAMPLEPSSPKRILVLIISFITSGFIALTLGLLREMFDNRFRYPEQVAAQLDIPVIAVFDDVDIEPDTPFSHKPAGFWKWLIQ